MATDRDATTTSKYLSVAAIILGVLLAVMSLLADEIGVSGGGEGIGWKQLIGAIVGMVIALAGVTLLVRPRSLPGND